MLMDQRWRYCFDEFDDKVFNAIVPQEHLLVDVDRVIDWPSFASILEEFYSRDRGQPAILPVIMLKLEFLRYMYNLSDR